MQNKHSLTSYNQQIPDYIGIGAAKSGTTWLSEVIRAHPDLFIPHRKELSYFASKKKQTLGMGWYLGHFDTARPGQIKGEISVAYLQEASMAAPLIHKMNPRIKIILVVRDPVERAYSHYRWSQQIGMKVGSFRAELLAKTAVAVNSFYYEHYLPFVELFGAEQCLVLNYDDIVSNPDKIEAQTFGFLGVSSDFRSGLAGIRIGKTINPRLPLLEKWRVRSYKYLRRHHLAQLIALAKRSGLSSLYRKLNDKKNVDGQISIDDTKFAADYFREDLKKFSQLTKQDFNYWLKRY